MPQLPFLGTVDTKYHPRSKSKCQPHEFKYHNNNEFSVLIQPSTLANHRSPTPSSRNYIRRVPHPIKKRKGKGKEKDPFKARYKYLSIIHINLKSSTSVKLHDSPSDHQ